MVDAGAAAVRIAAIAQSRRNRAAAQRHFADDVVDFTGGNAGDDMFGQLVQYLRRQPPCGAHPRKAIGPVQFDNPITGLKSLIGGNDCILVHGVDIACVVRFCEGLIIFGSRRGAEEAETAERLFRAAGSTINRLLSIYVSVNMKAASPQKFFSAISAPSASLREPIQRSKHYSTPNLAAKPIRMINTRIYTAALVIIGDEILSGRTQDKNIAQIALWLNVQGIRLREVRVVADVEDAIVEAVNTLRARNDYLFTTGGIGPTHDDITVDAIAAALGVPVVLHPVAKEILERYYEMRGGVNEGRLRMARVPEGADLIPNKMSGAPGIKVENIFIMAGVPHITAGMLDALTGTLEGGAPLLSHQLGCWVAESEIAKLLGDTEKAHEGCQIGSYPFFREGRVGANFVVRSTDAHVLAMCVAALKAGLEAIGRDVVDGGI